MSPLPPVVDLGDGVLLRKLRMEDLDEVWALVDAERDRLGVWMPWVEGTTTIDDQRAWLESVVRDESNLDGLGIFVEGRYAGGTGIALDEFGMSGDIGYWIATEYEGRGLVTRAVRAMVDIGFRDLGLHRIVIRAGAENRRSRTIPERLGFTPEGVARGAGRGSGGFYDLVVYGLLEDEWPPTA